MALVYGKQALFARLSDVLCLGIPNFPLLIVSTEGTPMGLLIVEMFLERCTERGPRRSVAGRSRACMVGCKHGLEN